jgi:hypothetical protein
VSAHFYYSFELMKIPSQVKLLFSSSLDSFPLLELKRLRKVTKNIGYPLCCFNQLSPQQTPSPRHSLKSILTIQFNLSAATMTATSPIRGLRHTKKHNYSQGIDPNERLNSNLKRGGVGFAYLSNSHWTISRMKNKWQLMIDCASKLKSTN